MDILVADVLGVIFANLRPVDCRAFLYVSKRHSTMFKSITSKPHMWYVRGMERMESRVSRYIGRIILTSHQMHILNKILVRGPGTYYVHDQYLIMSILPRVLSIFDSTLIGKTVNTCCPKKLYNKNRRLLEGFLCCETKEEEDPFASEEDSEEDIDVLSCLEKQDNSDVDLFIANEVIDEDPTKTILVKERSDKYDTPHYLAYPVCTTTNTRFSVTSRSNGTSVNTLLIEILNHFPGETVIVSETRKVDFLLDLHKIDRTRVRFYEPDTEYIEVKNVIILDNLHNKLSTILTPGLRSTEVRVFSINKDYEYFLSYIVVSTMLREDKRDKYVLLLQEDLRKVGYSLDILNWNIWKRLMAILAVEDLVDNDTLDNLKRRLGSVCYIDKVTYIEDMKPILVCH